MQQLINIGNIANDGTGDNLRTAFEKTNSNFTELFNKASPTVNNLGTDGEGLYVATNGTILDFKRLAGTQGAVVTATDTTVTISVDLTGQPILGVAAVAATGNISTSAKFVGQLSGQVESVDSKPAVIGDVVGNVTGKNGVVLSPKSPLYAPAKVDNVAILDLARQATGFSFGKIFPVCTTPLEFLLCSLSVNFGTLLQPSPVGISGGTFSELING